MVAVLDHPRLAKPDTTAMAAPDTAPIPRPIPRRYRALWVRLWRFDCGGFDCQGLRVCAASKTTGPRPMPRRYRALRARLWRFDCGGFDCHCLDILEQLQQHITATWGISHFFNACQLILFGATTKLTHLAGNGAWALSTRVCVFPDVEALRQYYRNHDVLSA